MLFPVLQSPIGKKPWRSKTPTTILPPLPVRRHTLEAVPSADISDRLPTLSATQALKNLSSAPRSPIPTSLKHLDDILQGRDNDMPSQDNLPGGMSRGEVTEIFGPPGIGKTTLAYVFANSNYSASPFL